MYRVYMSDSVFLYARQKTKQDRYFDLIRPKKEDERSAEDIAREIIIKAGLKVNLTGEEGTDGTV